MIQILLSCHDIERLREACEFELPKALAKQEQAGNAKDTVFLLGAVRRIEASIERLSAAREGIVEMTWDDLAWLRGMVSLMRLNGHRGQPVVEVEACDDLYGRLTEALNRYLEQLNSLQGIQAGRG